MFDRLAHDTTICDEEDCGHLHSVAYCLCARYGHQERDLFLMMMYKVADANKCLPVQ